MISGAIVLCKMILHKPHECIPTKENPAARISVPWWNKDCDKAVRDRNQAYRALRNGKNRKERDRVQKVESQDKESDQVCKKAVLEEILWRVRGGLISGKSMGCSSPHVRGSEKRECQF